MLIGNRYAENKLYRGIKYYDSLPLTSGDLHESADIISSKNKLLTENLLGSGTINQPGLSITSTGVSLSTPAVLLIEGDIVVVQTDSEILKVSDIVASNVYPRGILCVVGWYQSLNANSTLRAYGGVRNSIIPNDIIDTQNTRLNMTVSTRYQFRWDTVIVDSSSFNETATPLTINLSNRDEHGSIDTETPTISLVSSQRIGNIRIAPAPVTMDYAESDLYIIPILDYQASGSTIQSVKPVKSIKLTVPLIKSATEPVGIFNDNTLWYNTETSRFKIFVEGVGFVSTTSETTLLQHTNTVNISNATTIASNIRVDIGIPEFDISRDTLQVSYNGVVLTPSINYRVIESDKIDLIGFTTEIGDLVTFTVTRLVESSSMNSIVSDYNIHINTGATSSIRGHVHLSDTPSRTSGASTSSAATPKCVYEATTLVDSVTNNRYRLKVSNGVLGIELISD